MNKRHLTTPERQMLRSLADDAGVVELLRCIAGIVANDHFDVAAGGDYRSEIMKIAKSIDQDGGPDVEAQGESRRPPR